jgi:hypothetical protein
MTHDPICKDGVVFFRQNKAAAILCQAASSSGIETGPFATHVSRPTSENAQFQAETPINLKKSAFHAKENLAQGLRKGIIFGFDNAIPKFF